MAHKRGFAQVFGPGAVDPGMGVYQNLGIGLPMDAHGRGAGGQGPAKFARGAASMAAGWTCPACGNSNFADRDVCNMRKCGQPRPREVVPQHAGRQMHGHHAPMRMQAPMHAQGPMMMVPVHHVQQHLRQPVMQQMVPQQLLPMPAAQGGWTCVKCQNSNFADREFCNMRKCGAPRSDSVTAQGAPAHRPRHVEPPSERKPAPEDGWTCEKCGNVNFADRETCFMRKCGAVRPGLEGTVSPRGPVDSPSRGMPASAASDAGDYGGEWECPACGNSNFPDRALCNMRKCQQLRPLSEWECSCGNKNYPDRMHCNLRKCGLQRQDLHPKAVAALVAMGKGGGKGGGGNGAMRPQGVHAMPGQMIMNGGMPHLMGLPPMYGGPR